MTISINGYKVTADKDTLNYLSILAYEASVGYTKKGYEGLAQSAQEFCDEIYNQLDKKGYYGIK